jgi:heme a synthase
MTSLAETGARDNAINAPDAARLLPVRVWLFAVAALVFAMVVVGGATRLTGSGLSITEWRPILGAIPPMSDAAWQNAFEKYQQIPQYRQVNAGMSLEAFKAIYWWEWTHRLLGRLIGFVFLIPFAVFLARGAIPRRFVAPVAALFVLGAAQGALGWFMVMSGLSERVSVSQYRLAAHLALAVAIGGYAFWLGLLMRAMNRNGRHCEPRLGGRGKLREAIHDLIADFPGSPRRQKPPRDDDLSSDAPAMRATSDRDAARSSSAAKIGAGVLSGLIYLQIVAGAFVAGLHGGLASNTWPLMNGEILPPGLDVLSPWWLNLFENPLAAQFAHRALAYAIAIFAAVFAIWAWRSARAMRLPLLALNAAILAQIALGVATVIYGVPLGIALAHQANAILLFALALWTLRRAYAAESA